jgi:very-short-patch-repair endonuclease
MGGQHDPQRRAGARCRVDGDGARRWSRVAAVAERQKGNVTREQLIACGLGPDAVDNWVKSGRLISKHRGVYRLGHDAAPAYADEMAAVLACGDGAVLSHGSAARLWGLLSRPDSPRPISVLLAGRNPGLKPGIRIHRTRSLPRAETTRRHDIPVTTPTRTLLDLASEASTNTLARALNEAQVLGLARPADLLPLLAGHPRHRGASTLRALVGGPDVAMTRSEAERRFLALTEAAKLPRPRVNARVGAYEVDFLWPGQRLVVEVDGFRFHSSRVAFERDHARGADLAAIGYTTIRVTWRQIADEPHALVARIAQALATASGARS